MSVTTNTQFSMILPPEWNDTTIFTFEGPHDDGLQHNLVVVVDPYVEKNVDVKKYAQTQIATTLSFLPGFEMVSEAAGKRGDGALTYQICYKYACEGSQTIFQKQVYIADKNALCIFTASFTKKTLKTIMPIVDAAIAGCRIIDNKETAQRAALSA